MSCLNINVDTMQVFIHANSVFHEKSFEKRMQERSSIEYVGLISFICNKDSGRPVKTNEDLYQKLSLIFLTQNFIPIESYGARP